MKKKKLNLDELKVQSFVTEFNKADDQTDNLQGGITGNCGTPVGVTCARDCDFILYLWQNVLPVGLYAA